MNCVTPLCRVGSKRLIADKLIKLFPEEAYIKYIEPFAGSGSVFFAKEKASDLNVLNDIDNILVWVFKTLPKLSKNLKDYDFQYNIKDMRNFINTEHKTIENTFLKLIYMSCNSYNSKFSNQIYKARSQEDKFTKYLSCWIEKMKNVKVENKDYKYIIHKYDSKDSFFYLDPPYEQAIKHKLYKDSKIDYHELSNMLSKIKGKFLMSMNDSDNIRNIFKHFNIKYHTVQSYGHINIKSKTKKVRELIITNY